MSSHPPVSFSADVEQPAAGEAQTIATINASMRGILETTWQDYGHAVRSVHAKSHGLLQGELQVLELPETLAQGVFAQPKTYPVVLRFSTNPGDILDDTVSSPRGLALKIIGVEGERLPGSEGDATQDFVMVNGPAFVAPNAEGFEPSLRVLAATTDTGQGWKRAFSWVLRGLARLATSAGMDAGAIKALGGQPLTNPLGETFYTQTPFRYGKHVAKLCVAPVSAELTALKDAAVDLSGKPNGLRQALIDSFARHGGTWELRVQLRTNTATMPVEDASVPWPEDESPYVAVARITAKPQPAWSEARARQVDDELAFSPWHGVVAHQPLGSINRARKEAYEMSAGFRAAHNRCPIHEPRSGLALSDQPAALFGTMPGREGKRPGTPDAVPGKIGQPLNRQARRVISGTVGGLAAGALLSVIFLGLEAAVDEPSDLVKLKRRTGRLVGVAQRRERARSGAGEQVLAHGGHLALSAASGLVYGRVKPDGVPPIVAGTVFGAAFYGLAYGVLGPVLGVTPRLSRDSTASIVQHGMFHVLFGVTTAVTADRVARRI